MVTVKSLLSNERFDILLPSFLIMLRLYFKICVVRENVMHNDTYNVINNHKVKVGRHSDTVL